MRRENPGQKGISGFVILIIVLLLIILPTIIGSYLIGTDYISLLKMVYVSVGVWFLLIGGGLFLVILSLTLLSFYKRKEVQWLAKAGMVMISLSLLVVIISFLMPLISQKTLSFEECKSLVDIRDAYRTVACLFVGYAPLGTAESTAITFINFFIVAIIAPFVFFYYIFDDLINTMQFPSSPTARKSIAFIGAYVALRGALASYFVEFFAYGWTGMGVLAFGVFMIMMVWALIRKFFNGVIVAAETQDLYKMLVGDQPVDVKEFIKLLASGPFCPYTFLTSGDNLAHVENMLNKVGQDSVALDIKNILMDAERKKKTRNARDSYVSNKLRNLA